MKITVIILTIAAIVQLALLCYVMGVTTIHIDRIKKRIDDLENP